MGKNIYEVIYTANVFIEDPDELVTLCCLYDSVWLPLARGDLMSSITSTYGIMWLVSDWMQRNKVLFDTGVLKCIEPKAEYVKPFADSFNNMLAIAPPDSSKVTLENYAENYYWQIIEKQLAETQLPCLFVPPKNMSHARYISSLLAHEAFGYFLPYLNAVDGHDICDLILNIRELTSDIREGFCCYLLEMSGEIGSVIGSGGNEAEIKRATEFFVETKLGPKVDEYIRCIVGHKATWYKNLLGPIAKTVQIFFDGNSLSNALQSAGETGLTIAKALSERHSNISQAYKYLGIVKEEGKRLVK